MTESKASTSTPDLSRPVPPINGQGTHTSKANLPPSVGSLDAAAQTAKPAHGQKSDDAENKRRSRQSTPDEDPNETTETKPSVELEPEFDPRPELADSCDPNFNLRGSDLQIRAGYRLFRVHQYKLEEFEVFKQLIDQNSNQEQDSPRSMLNLRLLGATAEDFHNTLTVLYSSGYKVNVFKAKVLISTLKIATAYKNDVLQNYAIQGLKEEKRYLDSIEAVELLLLSLKFKVSEWESRAMNDLVWRRQPITIAEAKKLGPEKVALVAAKREELRAQSWWSHTCGEKSPKPEAKASKAPAESFPSIVPSKPAPDNVPSQPAADTKPEPASPSPGPSNPILGPSKGATETAPAGFLTTPLVMKRTGEGSSRSNFYFAPSVVA